MDILLIDPPYLSLKGVATDCGYHIGLVSLAGYLQDAGIETGVVMADLLGDVPSRKIWSSYNYIDYAKGQQNYEKVANDRENVVWVKLADYIKQADPAAVGIAYLTPAKLAVEMTARLVKQIDKDIKVIAGSSHPTFCPEDVMGNTDIDFAVRGEGEIPLLSLAKEIKKSKPKWETVPGIYYRGQDGQIKSNPGTHLINNLDELPFPARDLMLNCDYDIYREHCMISSRGCPYSCTFCADRKLWGGKIRRRSIDNIIKEMKYLINKYKIELIDFADGTFTYDKKYIYEFCKALIDNGLDIKWRCTARYDNLDEDMLRLMKQANCSGLYFGLESGSNRLLKLMDKKTTVEDNILKSQMVRDSGIPSASSVLFGLPGETKEEMQATLRLMKKVQTDILDVNSFVPLPGTLLYDSMAEEDRAKLDWGKMAWKSFDNYVFSNVSNDDFNRYITEAYEIANKLHTKTLIRYISRMPFNYLGRVFRKIAG
jgi:radical SAM superfamily enzyme YgiQ (UPF0313 family)